MSDVDQGWMSDTGPEWEDEFDDNCREEEYEDDGDYWRDDNDHEPDEPNCFVCYDSGLIFQFDRDDLARVCRACNPTRFQLLRWRITGWFNRIRFPRRWSDEEGPF